MPGLLVQEGGKLILQAPLTVQWDDRSPVLSPAHLHAFAYTFIKR